MFKTLSVSASDITPDLLLYKDSFNFLAHFLYKCIIHICIINIYLGQYVYNSYKVHW